MTGAKGWSNESWWQLKNAVASASRKRQGDGFFPETSGRNLLFKHLDVGPLTSRTVRGKCNTLH